MARKPKIHVSARKASESVVAGTLARMLGFPPAGAESVEEVCTCFCDETKDTLGLGNLLHDVRGLYPWEAPITREIMNDRTIAPLVEFLVSRPFDVFVVKDTDRSGADAIWIAVADPPVRFMDAVKNHSVGRGVFRTARIGESEKCFIIAIQLSSCLK